MISSDAILQLGIGGLAGFALGYALKKIFKIFLILLGLYVASLLYLANAGIIEIRYEKLFPAGLNLTQLARNWAEVFLNLPVAGFVVGFVIGLKRG